MTGVELLRLFRERWWYVRIGPDQLLGPHQILIYPWNEVGNRPLNLKGYLHKLGIKGSLERIQAEMLDVLAVRPCPLCGNRSYRWGPEGIPQRECHGPAKQCCGHVWTPKLKEVIREEAT